MRNTRAPEISSNSASAERPGATVTIRLPQPSTSQPNLSANAKRGAARRRHPARCCVTESDGLEHVALFTVNHGVDAGDLVLVRDAEAHRLLDDPADDVRHHEGVDHHTERADRLSAQLLERPRVDEAD